ncbi:chemotaxis protein CheW [Candidatus Nitrosotalea sp. TS]|uniref:chemotaxis protein CheW n=1 Tax=Candidatus Nitrosotalea sp. TS TaxID=2341020 RepID=UPI001409915D|nr:chemotaxis protein CheW [Candidatus Nitrosotalea sp. TS]
MSETIVEGFLQAVVFNLIDQKTNKKEDYGVSIEQVREIRPLESITKVPNAKSYVKRRNESERNDSSSNRCKRKTGF